MCSCSSCNDIVFVVYVHICMYICICVGRKVNNGSFPHYVLPVTETNRQEPRVCWSRLRRND